MINFPILKSLESIRNSCFKRSFYIVVSRRCNLNCDHCFMRGNQDSEVISDEIIKLTIDKAAELNGFDPSTKHNLGTNIVEIFGGEPMLFPEKVKTIVDYAKQKNIRVQLDTNGFWAENDELLDFVYNLNLEWIALSVDNYHKIDKYTIIKLLEKFKKHPYTRVTITSIANHFDDAKFWKATYNVNIIFNKLHEVGNSKEHDDYKDRDYCRFEGFMVFPDGIVRGACELCEKACNFGHIKSFNSKELYNKVVFNLPIFKTDKSYLFNRCDSVCDGSQNMWLDKLNKDTTMIYLDTKMLNELVDGYIEKYSSMSKGYSSY